MRASLAAAGVLAAIGSWASPADAQEVAAEARATKGNVEAEIVVVAERPDQARIDRRIYTIADDPIAQSTDMFEALGRIPSVSVTPDGAITLLGAGGVTVQINGQPAPAGNLEQILRGLQGAQVERIEVITNPSAQLSAQRSGGVINIITRRRVEAGFNGSATLGVNSAQGYLVNAGPSWSRGPWSVSVWAGLGHNESDRPYGRVRRDASGAILTSEAGESDSDTDSAYAWAQVGYKPDDRHRLTLSANAFDGSTATLQRAQRRDALDPAFDQLRITDDDTGYRAASGSSCKTCSRVRTRSPPSRRTPSPNARRL